MAEEMIFTLLLPGGRVVLAACVSVWEAEKAHVV